MVRFLAALALVVSIAGCESRPVANVTPLPSVSPHTPAVQAVMQQTNVPTGLAPCADSGSFNAYITQIKAANASLGAAVAKQWSALQSAGAQDAAISIFAADPTACASELGASGQTRSAASFVVAFADAGQAERAWQAGVLGFAPPSPGAAPPGIIRGTSTGLGASSFTYGRAPVQLACWRKGVFVAIVVFTNLDATSFKAAAVAVDARLN